MNDFEPIIGCDQPGHSPSMIRFFECAKWIANDTIICNAPSEDSHLTGWPGVQTDMGHPPQKQAPKTPLFESRWA